jgi:hypothetical protein
MPKTVTVLSTNEALTRERRTNRRLRTLINELHAGVRENRHDLTVQFTRLAQLQAEVDVLKVRKTHLAS